jgi:rod shape-determining protein MreC
VHDKKTIRRRRAILALLVVVSLILLTAYFGESPSSPLHSVQRGIVQVLSPIQEGASKALKPVRDIAGWFSSTFHAKAQRDALRKKVAALQADLAAAQQKAILYNQLAKQVGLDNSIGASNYQPVAAHVIGRDPTLWYATVEVDKGSADGVHKEDPVIGDGALVGKVSTVAPNVSIVTLITDHSFAVSAEVQDAAGDAGVLVPAVGNPNQLLLQYLPSHAQISQGQQVVTAGFRSGALESLYPAGIPIGQVSDANQNDLINNRQVKVSPAADLRHLDFVQILTEPQAGTRRVQLPSTHP